MVGIQLYIETETIKRPFSQNWFKVYSDFALQFILLSIEKKRHKMVADYLQKFLRRMSFHFWSFYKPKRSTPVPFIKWLCFTCVTLSSVQKVYLDIIPTIFLHVPLIFIFIKREMLSLTRGPGLLVINTIHSSNTVVFPSTTFFAETTASSKIATWKAMRLNDVALNYWTSRQTQRIKPLISFMLRGRVHALH